MPTTALHGPRVSRLLSWLLGSLICVWITIDTGDTYTTCYKCIQPDGSVTYSCDETPG
jgi:hypothetical protein